MRSILRVAFSAILMAGAMVLPGTAAKATNGPRVVVYYQGNHVDGKYVSPKPLIDRPTGVTDLYVAAIKLRAANAAVPKPHLALNDDLSDGPKYDQLWKDVKDVQAKGVHVLAMLGGADHGSFQRMQEDFETYYGLLRKFLVDRKFDGVDLNVEEDVSQQTIVQAIRRLRADFGPDFLVTLSPVTKELRGLIWNELNYDDLHREVGSLISWYNVQFYCGWGTMANTSGFRAIVDRKIVPVNKIVTGAATSPGNCGQRGGFVPMPELQTVIRQLVRDYPDFGGVAGWEYYNWEKGEEPRPWEWWQGVSEALRTPFPPVAPVKVTGTAGKLRQGKKAAYTITVTNPGPNMAQGVTLTGRLPKQLRFAKVKGCKRQANGIKCSWPTLPARRTIKIMLGVKVKAAKGKPAVKLTLTSARPKRTTSTTIRRTIKR